MKPVRRVIVETYIWPRATFIDEINKAAFERRASIRKTNKLSASRRAESRKVEYETRRPRAEKRADVMAGPWRDRREIKGSEVLMYIVR